MAKRKSKIDKLNEEFERIWMECIKGKRVLVENIEQQSICLDFFYAGYNYFAKEIKPQMDEYKELKKVHKMRLAWAKHALDNMPKYEDPGPQ